MLNNIFKNNNLNHIKMSDFHGEEDNEKESINKYQNLFTYYEINPPKLSEALIQIFESCKLNKNQVENLTKDILDKCKRRIDPEFNKIKKNYEKITKEDAYIICSYTCEAKERNYSPYRILNQKLVSDDRRNDLTNISKYLYILLKALRKLPRYYPKNKYLYRSLSIKVNLTKDPYNEKVKPYIKGNIKTFWGFTSALPDPKVIHSFLKEGTIFILGGDIWGYDIELFNYYNEKEILLEPERKFKIENALPPLNGVITINCTVLKSNLILNNDKEYNMDNIQTPNDNNLENEIFNLKNELKKTKDLLNQKEKEINDLKLQLKNKEKAIESLNNQLSNQINELNNIKNKINNNDDLVNAINPGEKAVSALFISSDQKVTYAVTCKNTTPFVRIEEKLYEEYPEYKDTENYFLHNGEVIKRFKTVEENHIKNGKPIILYTN